MALALTFVEVFGKPVRYMDAAHGGLWVAKDVVGRVQFNAGGSRRQSVMSFGVNIEFIDDLRKIARRVDALDLGKCLETLGSDYTVVLGIDQMITGRRLSAPVDRPADAVDVKQLLGEIKSQVRPLGRRVSKPHLNVETSLFGWDEILGRSEVISRVKAEKTRLGALMDVLRSCF